MDINNGFDGWSEGRLKFWQLELVHMSVFVKHFCSAVQFGFLRLEQNY